MSDSDSATELRRSFSLLTTEWWLLVGGLAGYLLLGGWVVATGLVLASFAPSLSATAVGPTTGLGVFGAIVWILLPALLTAWLLDRRLSNNYGNLVSRYRIDHPGVLVAPSGALALVFAVVVIVLGPRPPVVALGLVAGVHLFVRTIAYGRRVYSVSSRPLFSLLTVLSGLALATGWLVQASRLAQTPRLPGAVGRGLQRAGVPSVSESITTALGTTPETALGALVAVPALLSGLYLAVQVLVSRRVRSAAPLANPDKRAEQRFPIMPPVPAGERPGVSPSPNSGPPSTGSGSSSASGGPAGPSAAAAGGGSTDDANSDTRVFTTDEPVPEEVPEVEGADDDDDDDDGWIDDTAVFSFDDKTGGSSGSCEACGESLPGDSSVTFCPTCGQQIRS